MKDHGVGMHRRPQKVDTRIGCNPQETRAAQFREKLWDRIRDGLEKCFGQRTGLGD